MKFSSRDNRPQTFGRDPFLSPFIGVLERRRLAVAAARRALLLDCGAADLPELSLCHEYYGLHYRDGAWIFRERAPHATSLTLIGEMSDWRVSPSFSMSRLNSCGDWEIRMDGDRLSHGMHYRLYLEWPGGCGERLPSYARYVVQDERSGIFSARVWHPESSYRFQHATPSQSSDLLIYEAHVGMAQERPGVGTFSEFREKVLPRIAKAGYNTLQLMAIMNHPYYGSFGYHVTNFFSVASRFGTPDDFRELVDAAHGLGLRVIMDLIHSHAARNEVEGLGRFDGERSTFFNSGERCEHPAWDSLCFDYGKREVLRFLLSNCRFWLDEYHIDGYRFDGVTSMLYRHHGLGKAFSGYGDYFNDEVDEDAWIYLSLANEVIHAVRPDAVTIAEDVSGMPGLAAPAREGGVGFDYRLAMGVTDMWFKLLDQPDETWNMAYMYHELTNRRLDERTVSYVECHDQAIVGGQTAIFRMAGSAMYDAMCRDSGNIRVDRAIALHKMMRLATIATAGHGYLNFMGNEFGHPEWIDFPREGNGWSYFYARRQWSLADDEKLRYGQLGAFDRAMLTLLVSVHNFYEYSPQLIRSDELCKVLAFERGGCFFVFNFHPVQSAAGYVLEVPPGSYRIVLNSDADDFGGFNRVDCNMLYTTVSIPDGEHESHQALRLYLPCRVSLVLQRVR